MDPNRTYNSTLSYSHNNVSHNQPGAVENQVFNKQKADNYLNLLESFKKSAHKHLINLQRKLFEIIDSLNSDFININQNIDELYYLVNNEERFKEILLKKINEFNIRADNKYSIELRKTFKSDLETIIKDLEKNIPSNQNPHHSSQSMKFDTQLESYNIKQRISNKTIKIQSQHLFETNWDELNKKFDIKELRNEVFNIQNELYDIPKFFKYYIKMKLNPTHSIIYAIYKSCFKYLENSKAFEETFKKILLKFHITNEYTNNISNNIMAIQSNPYDLISRSIQNSTSNALEDFKDVTGILYYRSNPKNMHFIGNKENNLYIFVICVYGNSMILMPKKKYYKIIKDLWLDQINSKF